MKAEDWDGAAQMMGLALEYALKAAICKTLNIPAYPEDHKDSSFFMVHTFDRLLLLSGLSSTFSAAGDTEVLDNWSGFTLPYRGEWVGMRYNDPQYGPFDKKTVEKLYHHLYGDKEYGILRVIAKKRRW